MCARLSLPALNSRTGLKERPRRWRRSKRRRLKVEALEERNLFSIAPVVDAFSENSWTRESVADSGSDLNLTSTSPGQPLGSEFRVNSTTANTQRSYDASPRSVASSATGDFVVVWAQGQHATYGIYAQRFDAAGAPQGSEFRVTAPSTATQINPTVAMDADGDFVVTWTSTMPGVELGTGVFAQRFGAAGSPQGSAFRVNTYTTGAQQASQVAMDPSGDFVVTWTSMGQDGSDYGVYARRFNADGDGQGSEFRVNTYTTNKQIVTGIAMDADGDFVIAWQSFEQQPGVTFDDIYAQRFSHTGALLGSEFAVNTTVSSIQTDASMAMSDSGDFVIAWSSRFQDGDWDGVYLQQYDSTGALVGSNFLVNTYTSRLQNHPVVAMDADGDFVVVWRSGDTFNAALSQDGDHYGIYGQRFSAQGARQGSEFRINTYTTGTQTRASVAIDADGDFVVVWNSNAQDGAEYGIYAQRFSGSVPMQVGAATPTRSGVEVEFSRAFDASVLNLYDEGETLVDADVTLTGATVGSVRGSIVVEPGSRKLRFIRSGGPLEPDDYTLTLRSSASGFVDDNGNLLDGNGDGLAGDNYSTQFTVSPPDGIALGVRDVVRGPDQPVSFGGAGLPITINNAQGVRSASFALLYDPALLTINDVALGPGLSGAVVLDVTQAGIALVTVTSSTQLSSTAGSATLVNFTASVPANAPYGSQGILDLTDLQLSDTQLMPLAASDDDGIHIAAYFGDANGSQTYNSPDATLTQRLIVGLGTGFHSYQLADPYLLVDINSNGFVQSDDVTQIQRAIVGLSTPEISTLPSSSFNSSGDLAPQVFVPHNLSASVGETVTAPVQLFETEPRDTTRTEDNLAIAYNAAPLPLDELALGELTIGLGMGLNGAMPGVLPSSLSGGSSPALPGVAHGAASTQQFTVPAGAGSTGEINLLASDDAVDGRNAIEPLAADEVYATQDQSFVELLEGM